MTLQSLRPRISRWLAVPLVLVAFVAGVYVLMMGLTGTFSPKVDHGANGGHGSHRPIGDAIIAELVSRNMPLEEMAVGTIQPVHRVEIASRLLARAVEVNMLAGQKVAKGDVLVRLEDSDLQARFAQSQSAVVQAQAAWDQARTEESRLRAAFESKAVAGIEMDRAVNALKDAMANLARTTQAQAEARAILEYATIRSPIDGVVVDKRVNSGDTVLPGQAIASVLDPSEMELVASVRESLSHRLNQGDTVSVKLDVLEHSCVGTVAEIVPEADSNSRTFQVKVRGSYPAGVHSGMFGRLSIPNGEETVLLIPKTAVRTVGQLDYVDVAVDGSRQRRALRLGRVMDSDIEVLSGLSPGERIVVDSGLVVAGGR